MSQSHSADLAAHLELVEQNITLTLQQIDHNFAACHNTVATKLLPRVNKFGDISIKIWEGSQAWLRFFESLESSQKASIPLPPSPTETTNTPDRSTRAELSTHLEYSRALSQRADKPESTPVVADASKVDGDYDNSSVTYTPVRPNLSRSVANEPAGTSIASASMLSSIQAQPAKYPLSQLSHNSNLTSMDPPSLHFRSLHANNSMLRATPLKARPPKMASTPRLLQQVLTATAKAHMSNQKKRQTMTPRRDPHTLFDVATPCSDATTSGDEDDLDAITAGNYSNKKFKANESDDVGDSTDRYLELNSPPVTLQFTLPIAKTPGRTAVDAIIDEISPLSNSPSNTEFLTRIQEATMANQGNRGTSTTIRAPNNPFESSVAADHVLFGQNSTNNGGQNRAYSSVSDVPSFVRRQQAGKETSTLGMQPSNTGGSIVTGQSLEQFVTDIDDIDALLAMPNTPVIESARKQLIRMDQMPDRPPNPLFVESKDDIMTMDQEEHTSNEDISMEEQSHATTDNLAAQPNRKSGRWSPELSSTPMPLRKPQQPQFTQSKNTSFGVSIINEQSQISNIPSSAITNTKAAIMEVDSNPVQKQSSNSATTTSETPTTFDLSLFPSAFQKPPGSIQLQQLYKTFQDNADQLLNIAALEQLLPDFGTDRITLLVDLLVRRRFVDKHQDPQQAWNIQWSFRTSD